MVVDESDGLAGVESAAIVRFAAFVGLAASVTPTWEGLYSINMLLLSVVAIVVANIIYIDQPLGTGFSYSSDPASDIPTISEGAALNLYDFMQEFFGQHPGLANNDFYITGKSYAGHYIPAFAAQIHHGNKNNLGRHINLKGMAIGNGRTDSLVQYVTYPDYALNNNLINRSTYRKLQPRVANCLEKTKDVCDTGFSYNKGAHYNRDACIQAYKYCELIRKTIFKANPHLNYYDIRKNSTGPHFYDLSGIERFLNQPNVKSALGVGNIQFVLCSREVYETMRGDVMRNMAVYIPELLEDGIKLLLFDGEYDFVCNWLEETMDINGTPRPPFLSGTNYSIWKQDNATLKGKGGLEKALTIHHPLRSKHGINFETGKFSGPKMRQLIGARIGTDFNSGKTRNLKLHSPRSEKSVDTSGSSELLQTSSDGEKKKAYLCHYCVMAKATVKADAAFRATNMTDNNQANSIWVRKEQTKCRMSHPSPIPEEWYLDSGCSNHMTGDEELLSDITKSQGGRVKYGGGQIGQIIGQGTLDTPGMIKLNNVLLVKGQSTNLISVSRLCDEGFNVSFTRERCNVYNNEDECILTGNRTSNNCYQINRKVLCKKKAVKRLQKTDIKTVQIREPHQKAIQACASHLTSRSLLTSYDFEPPHTDLTGPLKVEILVCKRVKSVEDDDLLKGQNPQFDVSVVLDENAGSEAKETANSKIEPEQNGTTIGLINRHQGDALIGVQELYHMNQAIGEIDKILSFLELNNHLLIVKLPAVDLIDSTDESSGAVFVPDMFEIYMLGNSFYFRDMINQFLSQSEYAKKLLRKLGRENVVVRKILLEKLVKLSRDDANSNADNIFL
ncbi:hypothetical protein CASFOL_030219 [Castilleja foliolosa]|uniref:Retrovirus-related Pol polyprotein from transposon TNT 1-94-like beta-barrel domain-containing protein n=1 Tax=Castilleja foliolosa TaxID=1961234 RepID=A0ABD3CA63_9LAMI